MLTKRDAMTVQAPPSPREKGEVHLVKPNETLWQIAQQYNTTVDELIKLNNLKRADDIKAGKALVVP
jgi:spore germination protein